MVEHQGEKIKEVIDKLRINRSFIAEKMGMSRSKLYRKFKQAELEDGFILQLGYVIKFDFSSLFPELSKKVDTAWEENGYLPYGKKYLSAFRKLQKDYIKLLEAHRKIQAFLLKISSDSAYGDLREKIHEFIELLYA